MFMILSLIYAAMPQFSCAGKAPDGRMLRCDMAAPLRKPRLESVWQAYGKRMAKAGTPPPGQVSAS
jgi:hypothetical protein